MNKSGIPALMAFMPIFLIESQTKYEERKMELIEQWEQSMNLPRKKKKQVRKRILFDFNINETISNYLLKI